MPQERLAFAGSGVVLGPREHGRPGPRRRRGRGKVPTGTVERRALEDAAIHRRVASTPRGASLIHLIRFLWSGFEVGRTGTADSMANIAG